MVDLILTNGIIVTMDPQRRVIENGAVVVTGNSITFVGDTQEALSKYHAKKIIDCSDHIIMPGLIDAHGHAGHSYTRFVVKDTQHWMPAMTYMYQHCVDDDFWYHEAKLSALQRLRAGVTTGVCVMGSQPRCDDPIFAINNAKGYAEIGVRDIVCTGPCHTPWPHNFSRWVNGKKQTKPVSFEHVCDSLETVIQTLNNTNDAKTFAYVGPFTMITSTNPSAPISLDEVPKITEFDKHQAKVMKHISEKYSTRIHTDCFGGMLHVAAQTDLNEMLLGSNVHLQHCSELSDFEVEILAKTGTHATAAPGSRAPVHRMLDMGVNIVVTTDGPRVGYDCDMFGAMRLFQHNYRMRANDMTLLPSEKMLEMATINAAKAVGLDHLIGSLEVGKRADIITIDLMNPRLMPTYNPAHTLVLSVTGSDVDHCIINGDLLMENREVIGVDQVSIMRQAQEISDVINERANFSKFAPRILEWGNGRRDVSNEPYDFEWQRNNGGHYPITPFEHL